MIEKTGYRFGGMLVILAVIGTLAGLSSCRDRRSQYPEFDPDYAAEVFCNCMQREWGKRSNGDNWVLCHRETRLHSHYFDLHADSSRSGGFENFPELESPGYYYGRWTKAVSKCQDYGGRSKYDTITVRNYGF